MAHKQAENTLIAAAVAGDKLAMGQLLLSHAAALLRYIEDRLPPALALHVSAEDVLQDTLLAAVQGVGRFESRGDGAFASWLRAIAEHQVLRTLDR